MKNYPRLSVKHNVDTQSECLFSYIYGANDIFAPHCHEYYEIFITISGTVSHWINGCEQKLPEGSLVFIRPNDTHGFVYESPQSNKTSYINLTFTNKTAELLFNYLSDAFPSKKLLCCDMPPTVILNSMEKKRLLTQINELNAVNWQDKNALNLRMKAILADIFVRFFYDMPENSESTMPLWLSRLLSDMEQPSNFIGGMDRMVALSRKSREHLARSMKKYCGATITEYINELRINYASNLLINTNTPILDICFDCGFQGVGYFYKVFKDKYSISPGEFRKIYK